MYLFHTAVPTLFYFIWYLSLNGTVRVLMASLVRIGKEIPNQVSTVWSIEIKPLKKGGPLLEFTNYVHKLLYLYSHRFVWVLFSKIWELPDGLFCHFLQKCSTNLAVFWKKQIHTATILLSYPDSFLSFYVIVGHSKKWILP